MIFRLKYFFLLFLPLMVHAGDGSRLWLNTNADADAQIVVKTKGKIISTAIVELKQAWTGAPVRLTIKKSKELKSEGFKITGNRSGGYELTSPSEAGLLYAAFHLLRLQSTNQLADETDIIENPHYNLRLLNHWDNLNGTVERGYAGRSLWKWNELPGVISPRYREYARANASVGINGTVLNNVNASPEILSVEYLQKVKALADIFRSYGIKVYLSVNFSSPKVLGGLSGSDPLNQEVQLWWKNKVSEIYRMIPDFGGFLVKANSEGQPGPQDYGRTHAEGANMLADALKPYRGIVMWRAFVYNPSKEDRAKQAYNEFLPLDGKFRENVIVQVKNGPVDFQPREPFSPLFGAMQKTALMPELQITQEYLGFSNHLVFLATQWKEFFTSDTWCRAEGSTIAKITDGSIYPHKLSAIAGVANTGDEPNWTGHHFAQANWYAFGRLAWNHQLSAEAIAEEWLRQTFTQEASFVEPVKKMMLDSWQTAVNYMMPLGLHHIFAWDHHYGPEPWCYFDWARPDWLPGYYHQANESGIGFNRTKTGSNAVAQYCSTLDAKFSDLATCPDDLLLWFHHVPWDYRMKNERIFWDELCYRYDTGVQQVREFQKTWDRMEPLVDQERFRHVQSRLKIQARDAVWWKDACLLYFQTYSKRPIPFDIERPVHELDELKKIKLDLKHHN